MVRYSTQVILLGSPTAAGGGDRQVEQVTVGGGARAGVGESATAGDEDAHQDRDGYG